MAGQSSFLHHAAAVTRRFSNGSGTDLGGSELQPRTWVTRVAIGYRRPMPLAYDTVVIDVGDRYEKGNLWFEPLPHFRPSGYGIDTHRADPAAGAAAALPRVQAFLQWSRFPFFIIDREAARTVVIVNDYRYSGGGRDGWAAQVVELPPGQ